MSKPLRTTNKKPSSSQNQAETLVQSALTDINDNSLHGENITNKLLEYTEICYFYKAGHNFILKLSLTFMVNFLTKTYSYSVV